MLLPWVESARQPADGLSREVPLSHEVERRPEGERALNDGHHVHHAVAVPLSGGPLCCRPHGKVPLRLRDSAVVRNSVAVRAGTESGAPELWIRGDILDLVAERTSLKAVAWSSDVLQRLWRDTAVGRDWPVALKNACVARPPRVSPL